MVYAPHVVIVSREVGHYHHSCIADRCTLTCYVWHRSISDAAACAAIAHDPIRCEVYDSALQRVNTSEVVRLF